MREAYVWFFFVVGLVGVVRWARTGGVGPVALVLFGFTAATFFHGGMFVAALAFLGLMGGKALGRSLAGLSRDKVRILSISAVVVAGGALAAYIFLDLSIPKLGTFAQAANFDRVQSQIEYSTRSGAAYPEWTVPRSPLEFAWKGPVRVAYFLFSPFPWDVAKLQHFIGLLDGILYMWLSFFLWRNRGSIWRDTGSRAVIVVTGALILVFGLAIGNFGTGLRHRAKFVIALIVLASPRIPRIVFRGKENATEGAPRSISDTRTVT